MRNRFILLLPALFFLLSLMAFAQAPAAPAKFDPHDFTGIWLRRGGDRGISPKAPPMTPAAQARMKLNVPARSRSPLALAPDDPSTSNDPAFSCNPKGFPRILIDTAHDYHEVVYTKDQRMLQLWQEERRPREIWLDGRKLPAGEDLDNLGPAWYGHSVGHWEGDTMVVETVGLDDRAWIDLFGFPKSNEARVVERYKRVDADTMTIQLTLYDPKYYTAPWESDVKTWKKQPRDKVTFFGWYGLFSGVGELICAPMNANGVNKHGG